MITHQDPRDPFVKWPHDRTVVFAGEFINCSAIARLAGMSPTGVRRVFMLRPESQRNVTVKSATKIAKALGWPLQKFMDELEIYKASIKKNGKRLLVVPIQIVEEVDKQTKALYNEGMSPESCIAEKITPRTIEFNGVHINLTAMGKMRGMDTSYLSRIFSGERTPSIKHARKIAGCLGLGLEQFLNLLDARVKAINRAKRHKAA
jgi:hypothetical protein